MTLPRSRYPQAALELEPDRFAAVDPLLTDGFDQTPAFDRA